MLKKVRKLQRIRNENRDQKYAFENNVWQWKRRSNRHGNETYHHHVFETFWALANKTTRNLSDPETQMELEIMVLATLREGNFID